MSESVSVLIETNISSIVEELYIHYQRHSSWNFCYRHWIYSKTLTFGFKYVASSQLLACSDVTSSKLVTNMDVVLRVNDCDIGSHAVIIFYFPRAIYKNLQYGKNKIYL